MDTTQNKTAQTILDMSEEEFTAIQGAFLKSMTLSELWSYMAYRSAGEDRLDDAITAGKLAVEHSHENPDTVFSLANIYFRAEIYTEAAPLYERLREDPELGKESCEMLYDCYGFMHRLEAARSAIEQALEYDPEDIKNKERLLGLMLQEGDIKGVLEFDVAELAEYPQDEDITNRIWSNIIYGLRHDVNVYDIREATINAPQYVRDFVEILYEHEIGVRGIAGSHAKHLLEQHGDKLTDRIKPQLLGMVIHHEYDQSQYEVCRDHIAQALTLISKQSERAHFLNLRGICLSRLGDKEGALEHYRQAIKADPETGVFYQNFMHGSRELGNIDDVLEYGLKYARLQTRRAEEQTNPQLQFTRADKGTINTKLGINDLYPRDPDAPLKPAFGDERPRLPILIESSIDLKLTEDGQVKIIETNDMYSSGFDGFKRAYNKNMREDLVFPYHRKLEERLAEKYGHEVKVVTPYSVHDSLPYLVQAIVCAQQAVYTSATLGWRAVNERKDYLHVTTPDEWAALYPKTIVVPRSSKMTERELQNRLQSLVNDGQTVTDAQFIMKPCDDSIGRGVELVSGQDIVAELHQATSWSSPEGSYWADHVDPNIVVQECIRSKPVRADNGKFYDGTMRIAFTAVLSPDGQQVEDIQFYRPYWKLPANSVDDTSDARNSVVSFPPSSLKLDQYKDRADEIPVSARVDFNDQWVVEGQLRPYLESVLPQYAQSAPDFAAQMNKFARSRDDAKRSIALDLATAFTHAAAIKIIGGNAASSALQKAVEAARWGKDTAAKRYRDYLFHKPIETADHAAAIADRTPEMLEQRLGLERNEVRLETEEWFSDPADILPLVAKII